jgi:hypothetical protein
MVEDIQFCALDWREHWLILSSVFCRNVHTVIAVFVLLQYAFASSCFVVYAYACKHSFSHITLRGELFTETTRATACI